MLFRPVIDLVISFYVHDCARPMIRHETIDLLVDKVSESGAIAVARPLTDSIRKLFNPHSIHRFLK